MSDRVTNILTGLLGILGGAILGISFGVNPGPQPGASISQMIDFAIANRSLILVGSWMQALGSFLIVAFVIAVVFLSRANHRYAGWIALTSGISIIAVNLMEISLYLGGLQAAMSGDTTSALTITVLNKAVQHLFLLVPALLLPLGFVLLTANTLPRAFGYTAIVIGLLLQILGFFGLFDALQPVIDGVLLFQNIWIAIAGLTLIGKGVMRQQTLPQVTNVLSS